RRIGGVVLRVEARLEQVHADAMARCRREAQAHRPRVALEAVAVGVELAELIAGSDRGNAEALVVAERERVIPATDRAARAGVAAPRVVAPDLGGSVSARRALAAAREDL